MNSFAEGYFSKYSFNALERASASGLSTNIFASKYTYYIPEKELLIAEVEKVVAQWREKE